MEDFQEVKFFENRSNGQSKGFCVVTLGSEASMRLVQDRLPKKELHSQAPVVTYPTKQALLQFESLQKTRPVPPTQQNGPIRAAAPPSLMSNSLLPSHGLPQNVAGNHQGLIRNANMMPGQYRLQHMSPNAMSSNGPQRLQVCD